MCEMSREAAKREYIEIFVISTPILTPILTHIAPILTHIALGNG